MPRRPHPAATTTLKPNPELADAEASASDVGDEAALRDGTWDGPAEEAAAVAEQRAQQGDADADDLRREGATSEPTRQLSHPATAATLGVGAAVMALHPPPLEEQPRRRPGRPRGNGRAAAPAPAFVPVVIADAAPVDVQLSDAELQDLGAFTRLALKIGAGGNLAGFALELENMLSAYRKAQL